MSAFSDLPVQVIVQHIFPKLSGNDFKAWRLLDKQHHALVGQACRSLHRVHRTHPITAKLAAAFPSLTALNLSENEDVEAGPSFYHALAGLTALQTLSLAGCQCLSAGYITQQLHHAAPHLRELHLTAATDPAPQYLATALGSFTALTALSFHCTMAFQVPLHTVTDCKKLKSLTILGARTIDDDSLQSLTCLTCLTALRIKEQHSCRAPHLRGSGLKYLALLAQLQHLALGCPELNPAHLVLLEACPCLQSLDLTECSSAAFHGLGLQAIATHGSRLTSLKLPFAYTNSDAAAVAGLVQQLPCLQRFISSSAIPLSQHLADALGGLKHHCKALDLQYAGLAKAGVNLSPLVQLQGLQEAVLTQAGGELLEDEGVADEWTEVEKAGGKFAAPFTSVRACAESLMALTLEAENVTATGLHYVADTAPAVPVASGMSGLSQTASALVQQAVAKWTQLQHLSLSQRLLSDEDMHVLCSLRHLHSFSLSGAAGVRGSGFAAWPNNLSRLSHVNICECGITDVGVAHVAGLPRLHSLSLQYCGQVGDAAMHVLAERAGREDGPLRMLRLERMAGLSQKGFLALGRMQAPLLALSLPGCNVTDAVMQAMWESGPAAADTQDALSASSLLFQPQGDPLRVTHSESTQQETRIECSQSFLLKQQQPRPAVILAEGLRCLEFLDLAATQVSSAGLSAVLAGAPALTHLLLSACGNVRGEALLAAVRAGLAKRLLFVETTGCPGVRVDVIQALFAEGIACNTSAPYQA